MHSPPQSRAFHLSALIGGFVLSLGLFACGLNPNPPTFEGKEISHLSIRFKGEKLVDESVIHRFISSKTGTPYSSARIDTDLRALYSSGYVEDVRFLAERVGESVRLTVEITTRPPMGPSLVMGNTSFSDKKLGEISGLKFGRTLTEAKLQSGRRNIENFYRGNGYPDATVTLTHSWKGKPVDGYSAFLIEEGPIKRR